MKLDTVSKAVMRMRRRLQSDKKLQRARSSVAKKRFRINTVMNVISYSHYDVIRPKTLACHSERSEESPAFSWIWRSLASLGMTESPGLMP